MGTALGMHISNSFNNYVGGVLSTQANVISGNYGPGVQMDLGSNVNMVSGNFIGTNAAGAALGNSGAGVLIEDSYFNVIGGRVGGAGNTIEFNVGAGVVIQSGVGNAILGNSSSSNGGLAIDLGGDGVTPNGTAMPVLRAWSTSQRSWRRNPEPSPGWSGPSRARPTLFHSLDFYASTEADPSGYGEGRHT